MSNVTDIEQLRITRKNSLNRQDECQHQHMTMDFNGETVTCDDCGKALSAFWVLNRFTEQFRRAREALTARQAALAASEQKTLHLRAAQEVEQAWRSRTMVPTCPHCNEAIFAGDGFGRSTMSRDMAERRRKVVLAHREGAK
jgi:hypothetical protein